jgi:ERCC4-related helicase
VELWDRKKLKEKSKVLIFTYFKDTAKYLRDKLSTQSEKFSDEWLTAAGKKLRLVDKDIAHDAERE